MGLFFRVVSFSLVILPSSLQAQPDRDLLAQDEHFVMGDVGEDPSPDLNAYEALNKALGGDSVRLCGGYPCIGWVEDHYPAGGLKHRGYYDGGKLTIYKNYHPDGGVEREFRALDAVKCVLRTYHRNGQLRSEARYVDGISVAYEDHYVDGKLRYAEERHRSEPYFIRMDLFAADGAACTELDDYFEYGLAVFEKVARLSAQNGIAWEINELTGSRLKPYWQEQWYRIYEVALGAGVKLVFGSDAHMPDSIGSQGFAQRVLEQLPAGSLSSPEDVIKNVKC